jgi:hypothetical protein
MLVNSLCIEDFANDYGTICIGTGTWMKTKVCMCRFSNFMRFANRRKAGLGYKFLRVTLSIKCMYRIQCTTVQAYMRLQC